MNEYNTVEPLTANEKSILSILAKNYVLTKDLTEEQVKNWTTIIAKLEVKVGA